MRDTKLKKDLFKINIGCGGRPIEGYINIDMDSLDELKTRYPDNKFPKGIQIYNWDIFNLPIEDETLDEVLCDGLIEHLSFEQESKFFNEVKRVLKQGGKFIFSTTNFEKIVKLWLDADDDWKEFFRSDDEAISNEHWFGQYSYSTKNRWGYLTAMIFGSQKGEGQFHKNCYTIPKIRAILKHLELEEVDISEILWKGYRDPMIKVVAKKLNKA